MSNIVISYSDNWHYYLILKVLSWRGMPGHTLGPDRTSLNWEMHLHFVNSLPVGIRLRIMVLVFHQSYLWWISFYFLPQDIVFESFLHHCCLSKSDFWKKINEHYYSLLTLLELGCYSLAMARLGHPNNTSNLEEISLHMHLTWCQFQKPDSLIFLLKINHLFLQELWEYKMLIRDHLNQGLYTAENLVPICKVWGAKGHRRSQKFRISALFHWVDAYNSQSAQKLKVLFTLSRLHSFSTVLTSLAW